MRAPAHFNGCVSAPMSDPVVLEEPAGRFLLGQWDGGRENFLQIQIWLFRHCKMARLDHWFI